MTTRPSSARQKQITDYIRSLKSSGVWDADSNAGIYLLASENSDPQAAGLNLKRWTGTVTNLILQSQDFSTTWGSFGGGTVSTDSTTAPDGTLTADTITAAGANSGRTQAITVSAAAGTRTTVSCFFKKNNTNFVRFRITDGTSTLSAYWNINTGVIGTVSAPTGNFTGFYGQAAVSMGGGWYRCIVYLTTVTSTTITIGIIPAQTDASNSAANDAVYAWGAQAVAMDVAGNYIPTTTGTASQTQTLRRYNLFSKGSAQVWNNADSSFTRASPATTYALKKDGTLKSFAANTPRFTDLGLLIEEQRTNLTKWSQAFDGHTWWTDKTTTKLSAIDEASVTAPDGTLTGNKLTEDSSAATLHYLTAALTKAASALAYSLSIYAKAGTRTRLMIQADNASNSGARVGFDLSGGQIAYAAAGYGAAAFTSISARIQSCANGWYRCIIYFTTDTATNLNINFALDSGSGTAAASYSYDGNGAGYLYLWGAQIEQAVLETSYIPTTTATVTRSSDAAAHPNLQVLGSAYSLWASLNPQAPASFGSNQFALQVDDGTTNNRTMFFRSGSGMLVQNIVGGSPSGYNNTTVSGVVWNQYSSAFGGMSMAAGANGMQASGNGSAVTQATGSLPSGLTALRFGANNSPTSHLNGFLSGVIILPSVAMSAAQLQALQLVPMP